MGNYLDNFELVLLAIFIASGFIIAGIYDFFRAMRKVKKVNYITVVIQDIIFCIISSIIIVLNIVVFMREQIRLYIIVAMILGGIIYFSIFSNLVIKIDMLVLKTFNYFISFIFVPIKVHMKLLKIMYVKIAMCVVICCNRIKYVIFLMYKMIKKDKKLCLRKKKL